MNDKSLVGGKIVGVLMLLVVAGVVIGLAVVAYQEKLKEQEIAAHWQEYWKVAVVTGTRLAADAPPHDMDYDAEASRLVAIYDSRAQTFQNPELTTSWAAIETQTAKGMTILNRIGLIDETKPSGWQILANEMQKDPAANQQGDADFLQRISSEIDKLSLEGDFRQTESNLNSAISSLVGIGEGLDHKDLGSAIGVNYYPSWDGAYWGDSLLVQNTSGGVLQNAIVATTVHMSDGTTRSHLHYVDQWPAGATLAAVYSYEGTSYSNPQTANHPTSADVDLFVLNGMAKGSYALSDDAWAQKIQGYCSKLTFNNSQYLGPYADSSGNYDAGFQLQFQGLPELPITSVDLKFDKDTATERDAVWTPSTPMVSASTDHAMRGPSLDGDTPTHIDLVLHFAETTWTDQVHIY